LTYEWYCSQMKNLYPNLVIPFKRYNGSDAKIADLVEANYTRRPIFIIDPKENSLEKDYKFLPHGIVKKIVKKDSIDISYDSLSGHFKRIWGQYDLTGIYQSYDDTSFEMETQKYYSYAKFSIAYDEYEMLNSFEPAEKEYLESIKINKKYMYSYKNLGSLYYFKKNKPKESVKYFETYLKLNPKDENAAYIQSIIDKNK